MWSTAGEQQEGGHGDVNAQIEEELRPATIAGAWRTA
jgi:hypothetical protein